MFLVLFTPEDTQIRSLLEQKQTGILVLRPFEEAIKMEVDKPISVKFLKSDLVGFKRILQK